MHLKREQVDPLICKNKHLACHQNGEHILQTFIGKLVSSNREKPQILNHSQFFIFPPILTNIIPCENLFPYKYSSWANSPSSISQPQTKGRKQIVLMQGIKDLVQIEVTYNYLIWKMHCATGDSYNWTISMQILREPPAWKGFPE